jgi:hypothetical protein
MNGTYKTALLSALLPLFAAGCATQDAQADTAKASASAPLVAATAPPHAGKTAHQLPAPSEIEAQTGIQIAHVGLTAAGGLVDVRFKVLDSAKAKALLGNSAHAPVLIAGDNPPLMAPHHAMKGARFGKGQVFYILYPNARGAIQPGVEVTVAMGDVRLGPVKAQ